ncbi:MAG: N-acyl homoserine lactonase [Stenotrophomonas maltophilia]|nr:MAG: N-acyl homoserine lactonase [Stenotrophomonas maltophilia]
MREVRSRALLTGACRHPQFMAIRGGSLRPVDFPALAMLIEHPEEGPILFDTGYDPAFLTATEPFPERLYRWATPVAMASGADAASQCRALGIEPTEVRHLLLSHFHGDHIAGAHAFPHARIHCARAGLRHARQGGRLATLRQGILPSLIPTDIDPRARFFEDAREVPLPSDLQPFHHGRDILGDGSLLAVELPGHCPGHWGLLLRDVRWGLHFLVGDAAWSLDAIRRNQPAPALASGLLGDTRRTRQTLGELHQLYQRNPEIRLSPCHCTERASEVEPR